LVHYAEKKTKYLNALYVTDVEDRLNTTNFKLTSLHFKLYTRNNV